MGVDFETRVNSKTFMLFAVHGCIPIIVDQDCSIVSCGRLLGMVYSMIGLMFC